jgi:hypothetical protein
LTPKIKEEFFMTYTINHNPQFNSYEITFDGKPGEAVRDALKALRFRWHSVKRCWYGFGSEESIAAAITSTTTEEEPAAVIGEGYLGGGAVYGAKSNRYLFGSDLSAAIRQDLKAAGIKGATVKAHTYAGGQSLKVTVKLSPSDFVELAEFVDSYRVTGSQAWIYDGSESIHRDRYWAASAEEQERIRTAAAVYEYNRYTTSESNYNARHDSFLTAAAIKKIAAIDSIVAAYRYDCSNSMVDYYDTNFYYDIVLKPSAC